jgi:hypothetical protein
MRDRLEDPRIAAGPPEPSRVDELERALREARVLAVGWQSVVDSLDAAAVPVGAVPELDRVAEAIDELESAIGNLLADADGPEHDAL